MAKLSVPLHFKLAQQIARDDYEAFTSSIPWPLALVKASNRYAGRTPDTATYERIVVLG
ncbi:TPA: hypothetical protein PXJ32_000144 [Yersinia enterocolitica]|nr:hypothetical protein [Yersinia enterocolitica]